MIITSALVRYVAGRAALVARLTLGPPVSGVTRALTAWADRSTQRRSDAIYAQLMAELDEPNPESD